MTTGKDKNIPLWRHRGDALVIMFLAALFFIILGLMGSLVWPIAGLALVFFLALACLYLAATRWHDSPSHKPEQQNPTEDFDTATGIKTGETHDTALMIAHHPDSLLLLDQHRRLVHTNRAAEDVLEGAVEGVLISSVFRQPAILNLIEAAFRGEEPDAIDLVMPILPERVMRVRALPVSGLPVPGSPVSGTEREGAKRVMMVLRDETTARNTERMRVDFLANASHELRTPLASLSGFIETLQGHARDDEAARARFLTLMQGQATRMGRLVDDLLSLSRIELNEHVPPLDHVDVAGLVREGVEMLMPLAKKQGHKIRLDLDQCPAMVLGDQDQLHEVVQNLLENALKYSGSQSQTIHVSLRHDRNFSDALPAKALSPEYAGFTLLAPPVHEKPCLILRVRDEGTGIKRRHLSRLSERFYRVEGQKSGPREGTGLGLAIVKHIVRRHHGGFFVESAPSLGSVFSVLLPKESEQGEEA